MASEDNDDDAKAWVTAESSLALEQISEEVNEADDDAGPDADVDEANSQRRLSIDSRTEDATAKNSKGRGRENATKTESPGNDASSQPERTTQVLELLRENRRSSMFESMERIRSQKLVQGTSRRSLASLRRSSAMSVTSSQRSSREELEDAIIDALLAKDVNDLSATEFKTLEESFSKNERRVNEMREKLSQHQEFHQSKRAAALQDELDNIDVRVESERMEREKLEAQLQALREREATFAIEDDNLAAELHDMELQHQLESVAMLRIKADKIRREREQLETTERVRKVEIEAILEENDRRSISGEATLKRLLARVGTLQKELREPVYAEDPEFSKDINAAFALVDDGSKNAESDFAKLFDKVAQVREERWEGKLRALESELGELCEERARLAAEEREVEKRRAHHEKLVAQGLEYLVELELGHAPPADYVLANLLQNQVPEVVPQTQSPETGKEASVIDSSGTQDDETLKDKDVDELFDELDTFNIDHFAKRVEEEIEVTQSRIASHHADLQTLEKERQWVESDSVFGPHEQKAYDGSLGPASYPKASLPSFEIVRGILMDAVNDFLESYEPFDVAQLRQEAEQAVVKWQASGSMLERRIQEEDRENAVRMVADDITNSTLDSVLRGIFGEVETARLLSRKIADKLVLGSVFSLWQGDGQVPDEMKNQVTSTFTELQQRRDARDLVQLSHSRKPTTTMHLKLEKAILPQETSVFNSTNAAYSKASMQRIREELEKKRMREQAYEEELVEKRLDPSLELEAEANGEAKKDRDADDGEESSSEDEEDEDATKLQFALVQPIEPEKVTARTPEFRRVEKDFWNGVTFRSKHIKVRSSQGAPTALAGSAGGDYLAVGTGTGRILVYDVRPEKEALLLRKYQPKNMPAAIVQLVWSTDQGSLLLSLDEAGTVRLLSTLPSPQHAGKTHVWQKVLKPVVLEELLELTWQDFDRPVQENLYDDDDDIEQYKAKIRAKQRKRKRRYRLVEPSEEELQPVHVAFHTAHTLFGVQLSIMIALKNGDLVKWNTDHEKSYGDRSVYCPSHAHVEPQNPRDPNVLPGNPRHKGELFGSTIRREFYQGHKHSPKFIGFVNRCSEIMYTVDEKDRMRLWPYEPSQFSGFGWYVPLQRFTLDLRAISYTADRAFPVEKVFPPEGVEIPFAPPPKTLALSSARSAESKALDEEKALEKDVNFLTLARDEERLIATLELQDKPWLVRETGEKQRVMQVFAPDDVPDDKSSPHHVLIHSKGGTLVQHMISYFSPQVSEGILEDVSLSHAGSEILFLVRYPATAEKPGTLRIFVYDTVTLGLEPTAVEILMEGKIRPRLAVSPLLKEVGSDYVYILMNSCVHVVSLTSGLFATQRLNPLGKNVEPGVRLTDLVLLRDHQHLACTGPASDTVYLFAIDNPAQGSGDLLMDRYHRPRMEHTPRECDV
ncbi:Hypothetical Protein FCC1311_001802 [Hondaea fermentalgiana]|uniref:Uncharacterized protein n=1 Tax=Hondaea fermentalgiana TaxID=2315210 RepID=A0A2R5G7E7_9STRA|nr:Hypothetical Protein FCC1311_001802 [Hondaea fermentalgiana]|eukprot:GBG23961.1 Hypothetical Protein FCC1311_001802 [Hondaea fermentalgiana]